MDERAEDEGDDARSAADVVVLPHGLDVRFHRRWLAAEGGGDALGFLIAQDAEDHLQPRRREAQAKLLVATRAPLGIEGVRCSTVIDGGECRDLRIVH